MPCEIVEVEALVFGHAHDRAEFDPATESLVVRLTDASGRVGIGEADGPPEALRELVVMEDVHGWSRGLRGMLLGRDPFEIPSIYADLYRGTITHARRGLGIQALSAVDVALYDLAGKQCSRPAYSLLGGPRRERLSPYATVFAGLPQERSLEALMEDLEARAQRAIELGYRAVKIEVVFGELASDRQLVDCLEGFRRLVGDEVLLMADFGYRWSDWRAALWTLSRLERCDLYFAEAVLDHDDLAGHKRLAGRIGTRLCGAELATTVHECREWIEHGGVDVLQPDITRCGGLSELRRIAELAEHHGVQVIPHNWKTGIGAAATLHFQAATPNAPLVEWLDPQLWEAPLRRDLVGPDPLLVDGSFALPTGPGLGVTLDEAAVASFQSPGSKALSAAVRTRRSRAPSGGNSP